MNDKQNKQILKKILLKNNIFHKLAAIFFYFFVMYVAKDWFVDLILMLNIKDANTLNMIYEWIIYLILFIFVAISLIPDIIEDFKIYIKKELKLYYLEVGIGFIIAYALMIVGNLLCSFTSDASTSANQSAIQNIMFSSKGPLLIFVVCIIGPIVEELVYRVAIQGALIKLHIHPIVSIIISGTIFGFIHVIDAGDYGQVWPYLLLGLFLGSIYHKNKSIGSNILIHMFLNSLSTGMQYAVVIMMALMQKAGIPMI